MTEEEWVSRAHPLDMIDFALSNGSERKARLFAAACCRAVGDDRAAELCEQAADGVLSRQQLRNVFDSPRPQMYSNSYTRRPVRLTAQWQIYDIVRAAQEADPFEAATQTARRAFPNLQGRLANVIREVFGNPFRPSEFHPSWRSGDTLDIARRCYDQREFHFMPVLADALEDAGCNDPAVISHCRDGESHVRGCWVLELVLRYS